MYTMKRSMIAGLALALVAAVSLALASSGSAAPKDPFIGAWESIDIDGSYQRLSIGGNGPYHLAYFDDYATACGGGHATAIGSGTVDGYDLHAEQLVRCLKQHSTFEFESTFTYDPATDTLFSWVTWTRVGH